MAVGRPLRVERQGVSLHAYWSFKCCLLNKEIMRDRFYTYHVFIVAGERSEPRSRVADNGSGACLY